MDLDWHMPASNDFWDPSMHRWAEVGRGGRGIPFPLKAEKVPPGDGIFLNLEIIFDQKCLSPPQKIRAHLCIVRFFFLPDVLLQTEEVGDVRRDWNFTQYPCTYRARCHFQEDFWKCSFLPYNDWVFFFRAAGLRMIVPREGRGKLDPVTLYWLEWLLHDNI